LDIYIHKDCGNAEIVIASDTVSFCLALKCDNWVNACQIDAVTFTSTAITSTPSSSSPSPSDNGSGISLAQGYRVTVSGLQYTLNSVASNLPGGCTCYVLGETLQNGVVTSTSSGVGILFRSVKAALAFSW